MLYIIKHREANVKITDGGLLQVGNSFMERISFAWKLGKEESRKRHARVYMLQLRLSVDSKVSVLRSLRCL